MGRAIEDRDKMNHMIFLEHARVYPSVETKRMNIGHLTG